MFNIIYNFINDNLSVLVCGVLIAFVVISEISHRIKYHKSLYF